MTRIITTPLWRFLAIVGCLLATLVQSRAFAADDFLPVEEAFQLTIEARADQLQLRWQIAPGYYMYQERFSLLKDDQSLSLSISEGKTKFDPYFEKEMVTHEGEVVVSAAVDASAPFALRVRSQGCAYAGLCYPIRSEYFSVDPKSGRVTGISADEYQAAVAAVASVAQATDAASTPSIGDEMAGKPITAWIFEALLFAMLGGMILNLMPCVFPVLSIKVISLAQADRDHLASHGWAYTLGIIVCFVGFGGALLLMRAGGEALGWGFQLQSPYVITGLFYLFFVMGLSLSGMLNIGTSWMGAGQSLTERSGLSGSFFTGVLAAVVASPCTAPFMGAALGYALTQPGLVSILVFVALGFGMALPMLLLCYMPSLVDKMPRPGLWMETLKEILAFPLYITCVWLLWVLGGQVGLNTVMSVCLGAVLVVFGVWLYNRQFDSSVATWLRRATVAGVWILAVAMPYQLLADKEDDALWQPYSPAALEAARATGKPVFVNLTADWCITCLANERVALGTDDVIEALKSRDVIALKGDWTNEDPTITALLKEYGRSGVPMYLWIPAGHQGQAIVLPQILTKGIVLDALNGQTQAVAAN